ncbi:unnamed protein product [Effrenium voratum]|nr:unnamed protein product [Effrenium voratum]
MKPAGGTNCGPCKRSRTRKATNEQGPGLFLPEACGTPDPPLGLGRNKRELAVSGSARYWYQASSRRATKPQSNGSNAASAEAMQSIQRNSGAESSKSAEKRFMLIHIPKTAGVSFGLDASSIVQPASFRDNKERAWRHTYHDENQQDIVMLRHPLEHVLSQFMECKYDWWGSMSVRGTAFPMGPGVYGGFEAWTTHFLQLRNEPVDGMLPDSEDWAREVSYQCYNPWNMQSRYMATLWQHWVPFGELEPDMQTATRHLERVDVLGLQELYVESLCLVYLAQHGALPDTCRCGGPGPLNQTSHESHNVPQHSIEDLPDELQQKMSKMVHQDAQLFALGLKRVETDLRRAEKRTGIKIVCEDRLDDVWRKVARLGRAGAWHSALQLLEEANQAGQLDVVLCNAAVTACGRSQAWQAAVALLQSMSTKRLGLPAPDQITVNSALNALAASWASALQLLWELRSGRWLRLRPNTVSFNTVLSACARSQQWQSALNLFSALMEESHGDCTGAPDLVSFNTAMSACERVSRWQTCALLAAAAEDRGLQLDLVSFNTLLSSSARSSEWPRALLLVTELLSGGTADSASLGAAFAACEQGAQWQAALSLLQHARAQRLSGYGAMGSLRVAGRWQEALQILQELESSGDADVVAYSAALSVLEKAGRWQLALNCVLPEMHLRSVMPDAYTFSTLLRSCAVWASSQVGEAAVRAGEELLRQAQQSGQANEVVVAAMLRLLEQAELWTKALELLKEHRRKPNLIHYATAASACAKARRWEACLALLQQLDEASTTPDVVVRSATISACERSFQWQEALLLLVGMQEDLVTPDSVAYSATMLACNKAGRWDLSLQLMDAAIRQGWQADEEISVLSAGLGAWTEAQQWQRALLVLHQIELLAARAEAKCWLQEAHTTAMFAALQAGAWAQCLAMLQGETELSQLGCAVRACGMGRNWQGALQLMRSDGCEELWNVAIWACQASDAPQPLSPELCVVSLPM